MSKYQKNKKGFCWQFTRAMIINLSMKKREEMSIHVEMVYNESRNMLNNTMSLHNY